MKLSKNKLVPLAICLFLVHTQITASSDSGTFSINPAKRVSPTEISIKEIFAKEFNILAFALGMYHSDAVERLSKNAIKEKFAGELDSCESEFDVSFDLENMDFGRRGFTRYYPFSVNGRDYIIRIFDIREKGYLSDFEILCEGEFEDSKLGFQILPGLNELLEQRKPEKLRIYNPAVCETHS